MVCVVVCYILRILTHLHTRTHINQKGGTKNCCVFRAKTNVPFIPPNRRGHLFLGLVTFVKEVILARGLS